MRLTTREVKTNFIVALRSEAQAIIEQYAMRPMARHGAIRIYESPTVRLAIAGVGRTNAATAVGYLGAHSSSDVNVWLNIGIAGHQHADLGQCFLVDKLTDGDTDVNYYPSISFPSRLPSCALRTVSRAEIDYPHPCLYDMEGAAFFNAAVQFSPPELVALLKIVSDNKNNSIEKIDRDFIAKLVGDALEDVHDLTSTLTELAQQQVEVVDYSKLYIDIPWRVSESQRHQINNLTRRLCSLDSNADPSAILARCKDAREGIQTLKEYLGGNRLTFNKNQ